MGRLSKLKLQWLEHTTDQQSPIKDLAVPQLHRPGLNSRQHFENDSCRNVAPLQPCEDHVNHVAHSRGHQDEACDGPRDTGQLTKKIIWNIANESRAACIFGNILLLNDVYYDVSDVI